MPTLTATSADPVSFSSGVVTFAQNTFTGLTQVVVFTTDRGPIEDDVALVLFLGETIIVIPSEHPDHWPVYEAMGRELDLDQEKYIQAMTLTENAQFVIWPRAVGGPSSNQSTPSPSTPARSTEGERAYWERHAKLYDFSMKVLMRPLPRMLAELRQSLTGAGRVLEVAAGTGLVTEALAEVAQEVVAIDYASAMVEKLRQRILQAGHANVAVQQADIYDLHLEPGSFDVVVACNILHLLPDLPKALGALSRMLKPGGRLVAPTVCQQETLLSRIAARVLVATGLPAHRRFSAASLRSSLEGAGLRIVGEKVFTGLMPLVYVEASLPPLPSAPKP